MPKLIKTPFFPKRRRSTESGAGLEVPFGEGTAGAGFEVFFELQCTIFVSKSYCCFEPNRQSVLGRRYPAFSVPSEPIFQINGESNIRSTIPTLENVHIVPHGDIQFRIATINSCPNGRDFQVRMLPFWKFPLSRHKLLVGKKPGGPCPPKPARDEAGWWQPPELSEARLRQGYGGRRRRRRDSNPRGPLDPAGFQDRCLQPLGHSSGSISETPDR